MADERIIVSWFYDQSDPENPLYCLICEDPDPALADLRVSIPASQVTERAARAKLIEATFNKAHEMGLDVSRLRFHV